MSLSSPPLPPAPADTERPDETGRTSAPLRFACFDPRSERNTGWIRAMLGGAGDLRFLRTLPFAIRPYPLSRARAAEAFAAQPQRPGSRMARAWTRLKLRWRYNGCRAHFARHPEEVAVAWNGLGGSRHVFMAAARDAGVRTLFFELGPFGGRLTIDPGGVNFANSLPRDPAPYLRWAADQAGEPWSRTALRAGVTQRRPPGPVEAAAPALPMDGPFVFVPLQVPGDSQMRLYGGAFPTVAAFVGAILAAAARCPEGWHIRLKEHPSARPFVARMLARANVDNVVLDNATDTFEQVGRARLVVTVNSSVGLEAMLFDKPVVACGDCFWAMPGIAATVRTPGDLADVLARPEAVTFDGATRDAFLHYLDRRYYASPAAAAEADIPARLAGPDGYGFWNVDTA